MIMYKKIYDRYKDYWIFIALIVLMTAITGICNQVGILELAVFVCFQIFCVLLPGIAIMILLPIKNLRKIEQVLFSYASGYVFTIFLYMVIMMTAGKNFLRAAFLIMGIAAAIIVYYQFKKTEQKSANEKSDDIIWICAVLSVFFVSLIVFSLRWKAPYTGGSNCYEGDLVCNWIRDIVMFKGSNIKSVVQSYRYHYLGALQQAAVSRVTGISAMKVATCYSYIESSIFLGLSSYVLVNRMIKNKKAKILALLLLLFSTGMEEKSLVTYIWHIYLVPMSYHIAQCFGVMIMLLVLIQLDKEFDINNLIMMLLFLICCTGTKGATGAVIVCGICISCLYLFFYRKKRKMAFIYAFFSVMVFGLIYMYLSPTVQNFSNNAAVYYQPEQLSVTLDAVEENDVELVPFIRACIQWVHDYIKKLIYINPWTFIPAVIFVVYSAIRKTIKKEHIILFLMTMIGMSLSYIIVFYGHSEMYFALTVFPFSALLAGCLLDKIFSSCISDKKQMFLFTLIFVGVISSSILGDYQARFREFWVRGIHNLGFPDAAEKPENYASSIISFNECQAYQWIRENTNEDAVIISDGIYDENERRIIYDFTEREVGYYEVDDMAVTVLFAGDERMIRDFSDSGIDYIIQTKSLSPAFYCPEDMGEVVYENEEISVYKLF